MKTCASCGKANNPTRKYCLRCGKPLYQDKEPKRPVSQPISTDEQKFNGAVKQLEEVITPDNASQPTTPKVTTDDKWVKPSEISRDRVRTTSSTMGKSEMEKAKEAFARAEKVGIVEENGEIVETRMVRASEVQELMEGISRQQEVATHVIQQEPEHPLPVQRATPISVPEKPPTATIPQPQVPTDTQTQVPPKVEVFEEPRSIPPMEKKMPTSSIQDKPITLPQEPPVAEQVTRLAPNAIDTASSLKAPIPELDQIISEISSPDFLQDQVIRETVDDLTNLYKEVKHYETDLRSTSGRLEKEAKECWNKAEVKRIQFESLEEQLRLAKQEWSDASKVYQNADKRKKDEISSREKHIKDLEKKISKTEDNIRKRIKDLEREREKNEQQE